MLLMTHSLLYSWLYAMKGSQFEDATTERNPMEDFLKVLRREPTETTEAMQNGIDFEDAVTAVINGTAIPGSTPWYDAASKVADRCRGGILQLKAKKPITVDGVDILLYGRLDCLKAGEVIDIKFSKNYDVGKFFTSPQHRVYLELVPEASQFTYLVSNGSAVWSETYRRDETPSIHPIISDFLSWLKAVGLMPTYQEHWQSK